MSPPAHQRLEEPEPRLRLDFRPPPLPRPRSAPPSRPEGIVRAVLEWLDAQL